MPKYTVLVERTTTLIESADVEIDADDDQEAKRLAGAVGQDTVPDDEWNTVSGDCTGWDVVHVKPA